MHLRSIVYLRVNHETLKHGFLSKRKHGNFPVLGRAALIHVGEVFSINAELNDNNQMDIHDYSNVKLYSM